MICPALPWHRIVNSKGKISLKPSYGYELQKALLESEGIKFSKSDTIDLKLYLASDLSVMEPLKFNLECPIRNVC